MSKRIFVSVMLVMIAAAFVFGQDAKDAKSPAKKEQTTTTAPKAKKMSKSAKGKSCGSDCCTEEATAKSKAPKSGSESETKAPESKDAK